MITITYKFTHHPEWDCVEEADNLLFSPFDGKEEDAVTIASLINSKKLKILGHPKIEGISTADFKQRATITGLYSLTVTFT